MRQQRSASVHAHELLLESFFRVVLVFAVTRIVIRFRRVPLVERLRALERFDTPVLTKRRVFLEVQVDLVQALALLIISEVIEILQA